ncbi:DUF134 domain-containing protein [Tepidibacter formicigenes]|jgi:predicted DNA-binding protein (UPF0251 family)|uniref:UPF0251 protein SAMN02744037_01777 n=1 Tax=Tepidibacter formicigenes DSM 15518 TaxID=1123349 RepID=A0A1M6Q928_9FIRM|nr:DUF134 domain-containing protein [Tepidibacter formicigenes]SHK16650.1 Predicted DNA-binding protein, UPF0251 family [Tepidibacter formicigenes DSM 15518]
MPRPKKWRKVGFIPEIRFYGPLDCDIENSIIIMSVEELESIRLMDLEGLDQNECAQRMMVARSTFQRIYSEAKRKIADSIINGKKLKIEGGNYTLNICKIICKNCGYEWKEKCEDIDKDIECPQCSSENNLICSEDEKNKVCRRCFRHRCGRL